LASSLPEGLDPASRCGILDGPVVVDIFVFKFAASFFQLSVAGRKKVTINPQTAQNMLYQNNINPVYMKIGGG
jgi:hypothetical protein